MNRSRCVRGHIVSAFLFLVVFSGCGECPTTPEEQRKTLDIALIRADTLGLGSLPPGAITSSGSCGPITCTNLDGNNNCHDWEASMTLTEDATCTLVVTTSSGKQTFVRGVNMTCAPEAEDISLQCCDDACTAVKIYDAKPGC